MSTRERFLALIVLPVLVLGGLGFLGWYFVLGPYYTRAKAMKALDNDIAAQKEKILEAKKKQAQLERWKQQSLPADADLARREYEKYLGDLFRDADFAPGSYTITSRPADTKSSPSITGKGPIYTKLDFGVTGRAPLEKITRALEAFYRTGLLHEIKALQISRPVAALNNTGNRFGQPQQPQRDLDLSLQVEALIVTGAENRQAMFTPDHRVQLARELDLIGARQRGFAGVLTAAALLNPRAPTGQDNLAQPARDYTPVAVKNVFYGMQRTQDDRDDTDYLNFVYLTSITYAAPPNRNLPRWEAFLYDRLRNKSIRLRDSVGFDEFLIADSKDVTLVKGKVVKISAREVVFQADDKYYSVTFDQPLKDSLKKALTSDKVKELTAAADPPRTGGGVEEEATEGEPKEKE
jgi:hypothetical protein